MTSDAQSTDTTIIDEPASILRNPDGSPAFAVLTIDHYRRLTMLLQSTLQQLQHYRDLEEDNADAEELHDYVQRRARGELTEDERETIPLDDVLAELELDRPPRTS
jgi:hypothetical protein